LPDELVAGSDGFVVRAFDRFVVLGVAIEGLLPPFAGIEVEIARVRGFVKLSGQGVGAMVGLIPEPIGLDDVTLPVLDFGGVAEADFASGFLHRVAFAVEELKAFLGRVSAGENRDFEPVIRVVDLLSIAVLDEVEDDVVIGA
jgi:hypothetical protein